MCLATCAVGTDMGSSIPHSSPEVETAPTSTSWGVGSRRYHAGRERGKVLTHITVSTTLKTITVLDDRGQNQRATACVISRM